MNARTENKKSAREKVLSLLARRDYTEYQIRLSLSKSGYSEDEISDAVDFLHECNYLDDAGYAEKYLHMLISKSRGRRRVREDLRRQGLSSDIIRDVMERVYTDEAENELAFAVAKKVMQSLPADISRREAARCVSRKLGYQGYDYDVVSRTMDRLFAELE